MPRRKEDRMKRIVVIDGQGGGFGKRLIERLNKLTPEAEIIAVGLNSVATTAMLRAGASAGATGENAAVVNARRADVIAGPFGLVMADSMLGECTAKIAKAVAQSSAVRVLIPTTKCGTKIAGLAELSLNELIEDAVKMICAAVSEAN